MHIVSRLKRYFRNNLAFFFFFHSQCPLFHPHRHFIMPRFLLKPVLKQGSITLFNDKAVVSKFHKTQTCIFIPLACSLPNVMNCKETVSVSSKVKRTLDMNRKVLPACYLCPLLRTHAWFSLTFTQKFRKFRMECKWKELILSPKWKFSRVNGIS